MSAHTPGPWRIEGSHAGAVFISGPSWAKLAEVVIATRSWEWESWKPEPEGVANARLIAAAPELLVALVGMIDNACAAAEIEGDCFVVRATAREWNAHVKATAVARAAIAKARGIA